MQLNQNGTISGWWDGMGGAGTSFITFNRVGQNSTELSLYRFPMSVIMYVPMICIAGQACCATPMIMGAPVTTYRDATGRLPNGLTPHTLTGLFDFRCASFVT